MATFDRSDERWKNFLYIPLILLPPKEFRDVIKPKLDKAFETICSSDEYEISYFTDLEKNTIMSEVFDAIYNERVKPNVVQYNDAMVRMVLDIITAMGFKDHQICFAAVHYMMPNTTNLAYGNGKKDNDYIIRSFSRPKYSIASSYSGDHVRKIFERYYLQITNNSFIATMNDKTREAIKLCAYTQQQLFEDMDNYMSNIMDSPSIDNEDWKKEINLSKIMLPPSRFIDIVKPRLDIAFEHILSKREGNGYGPTRFRTLEKNVIVSTLHNFIVDGIIEPYEILDTSRLDNIVMEILTAPWFADIQVSYTVVYYLNSKEITLPYARDKYESGTVRTFEHTLRITNNDVRRIIRKLFMKCESQLKSTNFVVSESKNVIELINLHDEYSKSITDSTTTSEMNNNIEEKNEGENKMKRLENVAINTLNGGLVVRTKEGKYVSYDAEKRMLQEHIEEFIMKDDKLLTVVPTIKVAVGDIVLVNKNLLYVKSVSDKGYVTAVDFETSTEEKLVKVANAFNITYYNKVVSITQMTQKQEKLTTAEAQQLMMLLFVEDSDIDDIGKMMLLAQLQNVEPLKEGEEAPKMDMNPMMLMAMKDGKGEKDNMLKMMMLSQAFNANGAVTNPMGNPMMLMALMGDKNGLDDKMMKLMIMMSQFGAANQDMGINPMMLMMLNK